MKTQMLHRENPTRKSIQSMLLWNIGEPMWETRSGPNTYSGTKRLSVHKIIHWHDRKERNAFGTE